MITHGAMNGLASAFRTLMDPGDEIILIEPHFPDYLTHITLTHAVPRYVPSGFDKGFLPDPADIEAAITSKTKIILINSPNNPTGTVVPQSLSVSQRAAIAALDTPDEVIKEMSDTFERRVELVCSRLESMPGVRVSRPTGSFYVFADISSITNQSRQFALDLIKEEKVVVVPGYPFGLSCEGCIRIACTINREKLCEAMDRLERFLAARSQSRLLT